MPMMPTEPAGPGAVSTIAHELLRMLEDGVLPGADNGVAEMILNAPSFFFLALRAGQLSEGKSVDWFAKETLCHIIIGVEFARRLYGIDTSERMCEN